MLGSRADAEDIVQEAYVRWHEVDEKTGLTIAEAWLVTTTSQGLAMDGCDGSSPNVRRTSASGCRNRSCTGRASGSSASMLADDLSIAFLTLLERLAPEERAAFLLRDVLLMSVMRKSPP